MIQASFGDEVFNNVYPLTEYSAFTYTIPQGPRTTGTGRGVLTINAVCTQGGIAGALFFDDITMTPIR